MCKVMYDLGGIHQLYICIDGGADVGSLSGFGFYRFSSGSGCYGILVRVQRRAYVVGANRRGVFWRFGAAIYSPARGYYDSVFGLRTRVGKINLMVRLWMRDEILPLRIKPAGVLGAIHTSRSGLVWFVFTALDSERFVRPVRKNLPIFSQAQESDYDDYYV